MSYLHVKFWLDCKLGLFKKTKFSLVENESMNKIISCKFKNLKNTWNSPPKTYRRIKNDAEFFDGKNV